MSHHEHVLTASAMRAVQYARQRAAAAKRLETGAIDLLAGLVAEESRAWALIGLVPGARAELTAVLNSQIEETGLGATWRRVLARSQKLATTWPKFCTKHTFAPDEARG